MIKVNVLLLALGCFAFRVDGEGQKLEFNYESDSIRLSILLEKLVNHITTAPLWNTTTPNWNHTTPGWNVTTEGPWWNTTTPNWNHTTPGWNVTTEGPWWNTTTPNWNHTTPGWNVTTEVPWWNTTTPNWNSTDWWGRDSNSKKLSIKNPCKLIAYGIVPNMNDCKKFYVCYNSIPLPASCPRGQIFTEVTKKCVTR